MVQAKHESDPWFNPTRRPARRRGSCRIVARRQCAQQLLQRHHWQAINTGEIPIAADQRRTEGERRRGYPQVVFVQGEASLLASQLNGCVEVRRSLRDRFAAKDSQKLAAGLFQLRAPSTCWQSGNPEEYFAASDRTGNHAITSVEPGHPVLDSWGCPHQIADRVCVQEVGHAGGHRSKAPLSATGSRAAAIAASRSSTAAALG